MLGVGCGYGILRSGLHGIIMMIQKTCGNTSQKHVNGISMA